MNMPYLAQNLRITQYYDTILGTSECNVQSSRIIQEPNALMFVAPDTAQNDIVFLPSLEGIDASHLNLLVQVLLQGTIELHIIDNIGALTFVRRDDSNLTRNNPRLEELGNDLFDIRGFRPVHKFVKNKKK